MEKDSFDCGEGDAGKEREVISVIGSSDGSESVCGYISQKLTYNQIDWFFWLDRGRRLAKRSL